MFVVVVFLLTVLGSATKAVAFSGAGTFSGGSSGTWACNGKQAPAANLPVVAINSVQFAGGATCGQCLSVAGTGSGSGKSPIWTTPQIHTVAGIVTQGQQGDLDFPSGGDGKWNINWSFVACPGGAAYQGGSGSVGSTTENPDNNLVRASQASGGSSSTSRKLLGN